MNEKRFEFYSDDMVIGVLDTVTGRTFNSFEIVDCLNEQQEQLDLYKEAILTMLGLLSDKGIIFSGVKDE